MTNLLLAAWIACMPTQEVAILSRVADEYELTGTSKTLLFVIREIENGRAGLELGCGDGIPNHPARRYAGDFEKSLELQGKYAAGTIKKRYTGDLLSFAKRYCPINWRVWYKNATYYMEKK